MQPEKKEKKKNINLTIFPPLHEEFKLHCKNGLDGVSVSSRLAYLMQKDIEDFTHFKNLPNNSIA